MSSLAEIARALGGEVVRGQVLAPGPGHRPHDRSLSVWFCASSPDGFLTKSFAGDDCRICRDHVREKLGIQRTRPAANPSVRRAVATTARDQQQHRDLALAAWEEAAHARGTLVERYLAIRGLGLDVGADVIRFHPTCAFRLETGITVRLPTMLALMRDVATNEMRAIHRTALKPDGLGKAEVPGLGNPRKILGQAKGTAIKLDADAEVTIGIVTSALMGIDPPLLSGIEPLI